MKKIVLIVIASVLSLNVFVKPSYAIEPYDHNELLEYKGYGETMYESIVEQTTFVTGQYTDNKEYVGESINQVKDYANFWLDEQKKINNTCGGTSLFTKACAGELVTSGAGYLLTVGDFIKNMFGDFEKETNPVPEIDYSFYGNVFELNGSNLMVKDGWKVYVGFPDGMDLIIGNGNRDGFSLKLEGRNSLTYTFEVKVFQQYANNYSAKGESVPYYGQEDYYTMSEYLTQVQSNVGSYVSFILGQGVSIRTEFNGEIRNPTTINHGDKDFSRINNYIQNEMANNPIVVPEPRAYLSCPDGTKIQMSISGSTFLSANGEVMLVNKDGTANVSSQLCNLGWEKPIVQYIDDIPVIQDKDDNWIDSTTGTKVKDGDPEDHGEGCDSVLCFLGGLTSGIADIVKAILGLVGKILDGLLGLFVPKDLDFISAEFTKLKTNFDNKLSIVGTLKSTMTGAFDSGGESPLTGLEMSLPAMGGESVKVVETSFVEPYVGTIKKIISGILVFVTLIYLYRKITGRGGVMEK